MIKINNVAAFFLLYSLTKIKIQKSINLKLLSKLGAEGIKISVHTQRLHSLNNFASDDEITSP